MKTTVSITKNYQIHIPKAIREAIGLNKPGQAKIETNGKSIIITPTQSPFLKMAGKYSHLKPSKKIDIDNIRDYIDYSKA
jgi:AbrB family looped-hinge helix DNA binding protein